MADEHKTSQRATEPASTGIPGAADDSSKEASRLPVV